MAWRVSWCSGVLPAAKPLRRRVPNTVRMQKIHKTTVDTCPSGALEVPAGTEINLKVKVGCQSGCDLQGKVVKVLLADGSANEIRLAFFDTGACETAEFSLVVPIAVGVHECRVIFPQQ